MIEVSEDERRDWLAERSAEALRERLRSDVESARADLLSRGLKSSDPGVRASAERIQTILELLGMLQPNG